MIVGSQTRHDAMVSGFAASSLRIITKGRAPGLCLLWTRKLSPTPRRNFNRLHAHIQCRSIDAIEQAMARNFGVPRQFTPQTQAPVWPLWMMAFAVVTVINAATFLPH